MELGDNCNFQTPVWVIDLMIKEIPLECRLILEPTPGKGNVVNKLKDNFEVQYPDGDYFDMIHYVDSYHCVVGNPPFSPMKKGYEILYDVMERSDNVIMVMPWLTLINGQKRLNDIMDFGLKKIIHLPRSAFRGARVQTCIIVMQRGFSGDTIFIKADSV